MTYPCNRTQRLVDFLEVVTGCILFPLDVHTPMEVDIILPAIASLVCVGESCIKLGCLQLEPLLFLRHLGVPHVKEKRRNR